MYSVTRYHDISCGHRVVGHEGKCRFLHGHNYRIYFTCEPVSQFESKSLDEIGRVIDFGVIKAKLCQWLDGNWDHKFLIWEKDELIQWIENEDLGFVSIPFNPTAENMAEYLVSTVGPQQLEGTGVRLTKVVVEETRKCSATFEVTK